VKNDKFQRSQHLRYDETQIAGVGDRVWRRIEMAIARSPRKQRKTYMYSIAQSRREKKYNRNHRHQEEKGLLAVIFLHPT